jgi:hypothetical protein
VTDRLLSKAEYQILKDAGFTLDTISKYANRHVIPHPNRRLQIAVLLGRDPWELALTGTSRDVDDPQVAPRPVPVKPPHHRIEINPCADDGVCLAVRKAAMRPVANTLADQRREIPCASCKEGIRRARAEAAVRKPVAGEVTRHCADPDCDAVLSHGTTGRFCRVHANKLTGERRRAEA